jgi:hypothetical protein
MSGCADGRTVWPGAWRAARSGVPFRSPGPVAEVAWLEIPAEGAVAEHAAGGGAGSKHIPERR